MKRAEHTDVLMKKKRLRLSKYYVPYMIHGAENTYRDTGSEYAYVFINTGGHVLGIKVENRN